MENSFPILETERLILRQFSMEDLNHVFKGLSHPEVIKYYGINFTSLEKTKEQIQWFQQLEKEESGIWWAIEAKKNGAFLGAGGFNNWEHTHKKAEIGFWLLPEYWGKGIMKEGMNCICNYGFNSLKLHRIEGFVESENQKCISAIEKLNFSYEGTMKDCEIKEGRFISISVYSKINPLD